MSSTTTSPRTTPAPTAEALALEAVLHRLERMNRQLDQAVAHAVRLPIHRRP